MKVTVKLFASLREGRFDEKTLQYSDGITVDGILDQLGILQQHASILFVNGRHVARDHELRSGDVLSIFPLIGGG